MSKNETKEFQACFLHNSFETWFGKKKDTAEQYNTTYTNFKLKTADKDILDN